MGSAFLASDAGAEAAAASGASGFRSVRAASAAGAMGFRSSSFGELCMVVSKFRSSSCGEL
jgi:hypothetical protein